MVMRETPGFSVCPTVSDSMLKPRRRKSDATRFITPGLFSTWTTSVISMFSSHVLRSFNQRTGTTNHGVKVSARRHHGEDRVLLFHAEVDYVGTPMLAGLADRWNDRGSPANRSTLQVERLSKFHKVRAVQRRSLVAAFVEKLLPLPDHAQIAVVDDGNLDVEVLLRNRGQLG